MAKKCLAGRKAGSKKYYNANARHYLKYFIPGSYVWSCLTAIYRIIYVKLNGHIPTEKGDQEYVGKIYDTVLKRRNANLSYPI